MIMLFHVRIVYPYNVHVHMHIVITCRQVIGRDVRDVEVTNGVMVAMCSNGFVRIYSLETLLDRVSGAQTSVSMFRCL